MVDESIFTSIQVINTTIGDLVEAITEFALEAGKSEAEGYKLASLTIENILRRRMVHVEHIN